MTTTKFNRPAYAQIQVTDLTALNQAGAPSSAFQVYATLCAYAMNKSYCFPSVTTLGEILPAMTERTIYKALKWLETNGFIKRGKPRSRQRFQLLKRQASAFVSAIVKGARRDDNSQTTNPVPKGKKPCPTFRQNTTRKRKTSFRRGKARHHQRKALSDSQILLEAIPTLVSGDIDFQSLSKAVKRLVRADIRKGFNNGGEINWSYYPDIVSQAAR